MKSIITAVSGIAAAGLLCFSFRPPFGRNIVRLNTDQRVVALTFDDGPSPPYTDQLLEVLAKHNVKATFFMIGNRIEKHPETVRSVMAEGHQIGNHSYSHPATGFLPTFRTLSVENSSDGQMTSFDRSALQVRLAFRAPDANKVSTSGVGARERESSTHQL